MRTLQLGTLQIPAIITTQSNENEDESHEDKVKEVLSEIDDSQDSELVEKCIDNPNESTKDWFTAYADCRDSTLSAEIGRYAQNGIRDDPTNGKRAVNDTLFETNRYFGCPNKKRKGLSKTEEAVETEEKTHIHSAPGTPTPSLQNKIDDLPKLAQKPIIIESRNQRTASISSPISTATGTIKRDQKESTVHQKLKKDKEEKSRIETRQQSKK
ncbi:hypothetical protein JTB14_009739 [Gonioctena quinquepunctata]|nr:hypothetical protein JTB14_009739 [Gonioctena quinquepunctata]